MGCGNAGLIRKNDDEEIINTNIHLFEEACISNGHYRVHKDTGLMALSTLLEETRFADLLLVSSDFSKQSFV